MKKKYSSANIGIIITSIGESYLDSCIKSIVKQSCKVGQVIVVLPKKNNISKTIKNILVLKSKYKNQVYQRCLAKKYLKKKIKIILQLDCKFILEKNSIRDLIQLWNLKKNKIAGIGFVPKNYRLPKVSLFQKLFNTNSESVGRVLKSGNVSAWRKNLKYKKVQWLHGGCVSWNLEYCKDIFNRNYPLIEWSVAEDLLYSYRKSKKYDLIITNKVKISYLEKNILNKNLSNQFIRGFLHAKIIKNFVTHEEELSLFFYYYSMIFSSILGIFKTLIFLDLNKLLMFLGRFLGSISRTYQYKII